MSMFGLQHFDLFDLNRIHKINSAAKVLRVFVLSSNLWGTELHVCSIFGFAAYVSFPANRAPTSSVGVVGFKP